MPSVTLLSLSAGLRHRGQPVRTWLPGRRIAIGADGVGCAVDTVLDLAGPVSRLVVAVRLPVRRDDGARRRFLQARDAGLVGRPFFAHHDPDAVWLSDSKPAFADAFPW